MIAYSMMAFASCSGVDPLVLVVRRGNLERARELSAQLGISSIVCEGGERRQDSVRNGLGAVAEADLVAIHDGARPLVTPELIEACYQAAEISGAAVAAVPVRDTLKMVSADGWVTRTVSREGLWVAQTPQVFRLDLVRRAYAALDREVTDDSAAVELLGHPVRVVPSEPANLKITTKGDLLLARALVEAKLHPTRGRW